MTQLSQVSKHKHAKTDFLFKSKATDEACTFVPWPGSATLAADLPH
jgi:hypothetical protein